MTQLLSILRKPDEQWDKVGLAAALQATLGRQRGTAHYGPLIDLGQVNGKFTMRFTVRDGAPDVDRWAWFLSLANLFHLAPAMTAVSAVDETGHVIGATVTAEEAVAAAIGITATDATCSATTREPAPAAGAEADAPMWRATLAEFEGEPEAEAAIAALIDAGTTAPDSYGEEIEGNPTIVMWSGAKVAVVFPGDADLFDAATDDGWTILEADAVNADTIPDTLTTIQEPQS